jgi:hypothetical protein
MNEDEASIMLAGFFEGRGADGVPRRFTAWEAAIIAKALRASPSEAEERDAARYRWLRNDWTDDSRTLTDLYRGELLDKFVDAARSRSEGKGNG